MKISKKTREQAALICAVAASSYYCRDLDTARRHVGASRLACDIAFAALLEVLCYTHIQAAAEAEALLRTGWSP